MARLRNESSVGATGVAIHLAREEANTVSKYLQTYTIAFAGKVDHHPVASTRLLFTSGH